MTKEEYDDLVEELLEDLKFKSGKIITGTLSGDLFYCKFNSIEFAEEFAKLKLIDKSGNLEEIVYIPISHIKFIKAVIEKEQKNIIDDTISW